MALTTLEIMATILIVVGVAKIIGLFINPTGYMKFAKSVFKNPKGIQVVMLVLAAIALWYLLGAGITITTILAVTLFVSLLIGMGFAPFMQDMFKLFKTKDLVKKNALYIVIWILLLLWGVKEIFF